MARMARKGLGNPVGLQWGDLGSSCWGRGCCQPARFLPLLGKSPAQRSLSRAGTELVSRLAAPRGTGAGRSQGVRRTAAGLEERREGLMGDGAPDGNSSPISRLCWGLTGSSFAFYWHMAASLSV